MVDASLTADYRQKREAATRFQACFYLLSPPASASLLLSVIFFLLRWGFGLWMLGDLESRVRPRKGLVFGVRIWGQAVEYWGSTKDEGIWRFSFKEGIGDLVQETMARVVGY